MVTQKETREKVKTRREKMGGYFLNLSQLTFAAVVLGGVPCTVAFAWIGNNILK